MPKVRKMFERSADDWVYRLAKPRKEKARGRFAAKRLATSYRVPRQGRRTPRNKAEAMYVYTEAQRGLANRRARTRGSAMTGAIPAHTYLRQPKRRRKTFWTWLWGR